MITCTPGHTIRCAQAKSPSCRCRCHGRNHGARATAVVSNVSDRRSRERLPRCWAYLDDGTICGQPAEYWGGAAAIPLCEPHARAVTSPECSWCASGQSSDPAWQDQDGTCLECGTRPPATA